MAAQRESGPVPTLMLSMPGGQSNSVGGKVVLTATQSGATPERTEV